MNGIMEAIGAIAWFTPIALVIYSTSFDLSSHLLSV